MKLRVLIAEDEPPTLRDLVSLVESSPGVTVAGTATNGSDALDLLIRTQADLVLTDVVMPVMDGLEFIRAAQDQAPMAEFALVTGYDEFEYARDALRLGVTDYLLKPFSEETVRKLLREAKARSTERKRELLAEYLLRNEDHGHSVDSPIRPPLQLDGNVAQLAVLVLGWYGRRGIADRSAMQHAEDAAKIERRLKSRLRPADEALVMRSERDNALIVVSINSRRHDVLSSTLAQAVHLAMGVPAGDFFTALVTKPRANLERLRQSLPVVLASLGSVVAPYHSSVLPVGVTDRPEPEMSTLLDDPERSYLRQLCSSGDHVGAKDRVAKHFHSWVARQVPQVMIERALCQLILDASNGMILARGPGPADIEQQMISKLRSTWTEQEGVRVLSDALDELFRRRVRRVETRDLIHNIENYLRSHYSEPVDNQTLSQVFDRVPHYLSAIYKKHMGMSPAEHLTRIRISAACELMQTNPTLSLKDVAVSVGFSDQAYFSRVFRGILGCPPSEYRRSGI